MKSLFVKKTGLWFITLLTGIFLVIVGLYQLESSFSNKRNKTEPAIPKVEKTIVLEEKKQARQNGFFAEYRLERDRTRSQQIDLLREIVNNQNSAPETRKEAQRRLLGISQAIDIEMKLENLIRAENFEEAVVFVQDKSATVIVQAPLLTAIDKKRLTEIAVRVTGLNPENIVVIAKI